MGLDLLCLIKRKLSKERKIAFLWTFALSLLVHFYKFVNTLPNSDSLYNYYADQNMLCSGRWALSIACGFSSYFDLPWVIGVLSCLFIALTVVAIIDLFRIENPVLIVLIGGLFAASPATTETFFFLFTADGYMIAMFLSAAAVYLSQIGESRVSRWIISGICICVSCAIYQAYVSFTLILAVCHLMFELFQNKHQKKVYFVWIFRQICITVCALAAYYLIWQLCMDIFKISPATYQGISEVGTISLDLIKNGIVSAGQSFISFFLQWDIFKNGLTLYSVLSLICAVFFLAGLVIAGKESKILSRPWAVILTLLCLIAIVPLACIWHFTSDKVVYRAMMLQSLNILFVFLALLFEHWAKKYLKNLAGLLLAIIVLNNALMANISYFYLNLSYERTYADGLEMMIEIHDWQKEHELEKIAFIGNRLADVRWEFIDPETHRITPPGKLFMLTGLIQTNLLIDSEHILPFLETTYGLKLESVTMKELDMLAQNESVINMPCWPSEGSVCVMDGTLIIKIADNP